MALRLAPADGFLRERRNPGAALTLHVHEAGDVNKHRSKADDQVAIAANLVAQEAAAIVEFTGQPAGGLDADTPGQPLLDEVLNAPQVELPHSANIDDRLIRALRNSVRLGPLTTVDERRNLMTLGSPSGPEK